MRALTDRQGRVAGEGMDAGVAAHYGDPLREQRAMARGAGLVDRCDRGLVVVTGTDRLTWLHSLTSQHLEQMPDGSTIQGLVLSPHGHVEQDLWFTALGSEIWIDCEPGQAAQLVEYLDRMRFMLRVEVEDRSEDFAMVTVLGPRATDVAAQALGAAAPAASTAIVTPYGVVRTSPHAGEIDLLGTAGEVEDGVQRLIDAGAEPAGHMALDAWRVERLRPRLGRETDHRTIPHEIGLIGQAVHLNKGCYRGQETVARVHNLGRPPRRLVKLQVDGSQHTVPSPGAKVVSNNREVGFVGTSVMHHEEGPVALAVIKRNIADGSEVLVRDEDVEYAAIVDEGLSI